MALSRSALSVAVFLCLIHCPAYAQTATPDPSEEDIEQYREEVSAGEDDEGYEEVEEIEEEPEKPADPCAHTKFTVQSGKTGRSAEMVEGFEGKPPECFFTKLDEIQTACQASGLGAAGLDDCVFVRLIRCAESYNNSMGFPPGLWTPLSGVQSCDAPLHPPITVYLDDHCEDMPPPPRTRGFCSFKMEYYASPISLIWEKGHDIESEISFTDFPLEPGKTGRSYVWKASEKAPLLVYDPAHKGEITSATQLFGEWSFGGKRLASLSAAPPEKKDVKWENGYEALKTLDRNSDGVLEGAELEPLALWFDRGRDGVSSPGEVVTLSKAGVVKVYTTPGRRDELSGAVHAKLGYERIAAGKRVSGSSVDWYGRGGSSSAELASALTALSEICGAEKKILQQPTAAAEKTAPAKTEPAGLSGLWLWKSISSKKENFGGILGFKEFADGSLSGHAYSFHPPLKEGPAGITIFNISGKKAPKNTIFFSLANTSRKQSVTSRAILAPNGNRLVGQTTADVMVDGRPAVFQYTWDAQPLKRY